MAKKIYNLCIAAGKYKTQYGSEKTTWKNIGNLFEKDDGEIFITLDRCFNPAGVPAEKDASSIFIWCFKPNSNNKNTQSNPVESQPFEYPKGVQQDFSFKDANGGDSDCPF